MGSPGSRQLPFIPGIVQPIAVPSLPCFPQLMRRLLAPLMVAVFLGALAAPAAAAAPAPSVTARTGVLMDAATGAVLWQREAHEPMLPASTTKILTALVAEQVYPPDKVFDVPRAAENVDGTRFGYQQGMKVKRHDLLASMLMVSANDAAETLAAAYPLGGRVGFLAAMQAKAKSLGCTDSTFRDPSGLDAPGHQASAADLAILGRALLDRPELAKIVASRTAQYRWPDGHVQVITNHNHFVSQGRDPGALGIKTGFTIAAHSTIVAAQQRGDRVLIAVALRTDNMYTDVRSMFAYGFATKVSANAPILGAMPTTTTAPSAAPSRGARPSALGSEHRASRPQDSGSILERVAAAPLPAVAAAAIALLVIGVTVTAFSRPRR
jgi:serine-type D-Ala-D-Ala carboxypeptidase (penicillin-binding protein 5/6)